MPWENLRIPVTPCRRGQCYPGSSRTSAANAYHLAAAGHVTLTSQDSEDLNLKGIGRCRASHRSAMASATAASWMISLSGANVRSWVR